MANAHNFCVYQNTVASINFILSLPNIGTGLSHQLKTQKKTETSERANKRSPERRKRHHHHFTRQERKDIEHCPVCMEHMQSAASITLKCCHTFCTACLASWAAIKLECPLCRTTFKSHVVGLDMRSSQRDVNVHEDFKECNVCENPICIPPYMECSSCVGVFAHLDCISQSTEDAWFCSMCAHAYELENAEECEDDRYTQLWEPSQ
mmetsp:Transcript_34077/g.55553  ORF Transcript_34077/g.55553 Transcript_34077/m.55553 type:complete len:207 (-) Transcript_34077:119-739(-)|eukprot:CAMPEP_0202713392 /NCGR_PEP_ID=MMETSP1385-20130828/53251_1 /ASSEMBLY_ACC=CAM_ASM_000861 /TAXON_ID=933848 /ORGANISM="Elphidium margaritaceum" /LENGTH=206 /DNA_ID=CAMNT_0049373723 /DNA_START=13 /DNA_END=633 /DNA_ORIENTATION=+